MYDFQKRCIVWQYYQQNNTVCNHMCDGCKIPNDSIEWQVHLVIDRASLFTDQGISGLSIRAKVQAFQNNLR